MAADLVGEVAAEKLVPTIQSSLKEARHNKVFSSFSHLAKLIAFGSLPLLVQPLIALLEARPARPLPRPTIDRCQPRRPVATTVAAHEFCYLGRRRTARTSKQSAESSWLCSRSSTASSATHLYRCATSSSSSTHRPRRGWRRTVAQLLHGVAGGAGQHRRRRQRVASAPQTERRNVSRHHSRGRAFIVCRRLRGVCRPGASRCL